MKNSPQFQQARRKTKTQSVQQGFALIVTVTMLILLSLIAVGLLSLSTVTLRASNSQGAVQEAEANARIALMLAMGELQKLAGPDQRITATADIAGDAVGETLGSGGQPENNESLDGTSKGLTGVQPGTRHWTGVFTNNDASTTIYTKTPSANLEGWLVSTPDGETAGSSNGIDPSNSAYSANSDGTASNPDEAIVLVGRNSFGNQDSTAENFVAAPLVKILDGDTETGSYAWWVGDEGVKSRINTSNEEPDDKSFASLSAQRRGWEIVDGLSEYPEAKSAEQDDLDKIVTMSSSDFLLGNVDSSIGDSESLFHAATAYSVGLHTNAFEGGLKVDLTTALEQGLPSPSSSTNLDNFPSANNPIIPSSATEEPLDLLTWERVQSFYDQIKNSSAGDDLTVGVETTASDGSTYAIAPLISQIRLVLGARVTASGSEATVNPCAKVLIVLANPYSRTLKWDSTLDFRFRHMNGDESRIQNKANISSRIWQARGQSAFFADDEGTERDGSEPAVFNKAIFQVSADSLPPGQARAYTVGAPVRRRFSAATTNVSLVPLSGTDIDDFKNCVEVVTTDKFDLSGEGKQFDVREQSCTSLIQLVMSEGGNELRKLSGFELNNLSHGETRKTFKKGFRTPVPLYAFRFEISQPGVDYEKTLGIDQHGQRASAVRTFADFNLQATHYDATIASYVPPPFFIRNITSANEVNGKDPVDNGLTGTGFSEGLEEEPLPWGPSSLSGSPETILYTVPEALSSLAQLQHLDLTVDDTKVSVAHQPGYAVGNSYATPFVKRDVVFQRRNDYLTTFFQQGVSSARNYYDISYLLNASLWDRYFFSTLDDSPDAPLDPNEILLSKTAADSPVPSEIAADLAYRGMFNINSTSISAWKAFLASSRDYLNEENDGSSSRISFPRSLQQLPSGTDTPTGSGVDSFGGSRLLSDAEVDALAREIVSQVRLRGPFVSLSQFVNRSLTAATTDPDLNQFNRSGPLQQALEDSNINVNREEETTPFTDPKVDFDVQKAAFAFNGRSPVAELNARGGDSTPPRSSGRDQDWAASADDGNYKTFSSNAADRTLTSGAPDEFGSRFAAIPAWVNQADILQALGPAMSVRSDTFRIRTCGRSHDANGKILAVAYAEAIVQRVPDFVDPIDASTTNINNLNSINQRYGRRFEIVSFRWLKENEI